MNDVKRWPTKDELEVMSVAERSQYVREHTAVAIAALSTAKRLLAQATPLPWQLGFWSGFCHIEAHGTSHPGSPDCKYDPVLVDGTGVAATTPGVDVIGTHYDELAMSDSDAALIVYAVNRLPDYLAAVEALERLVETVRWEVDGHPVKYPIIPAGAGRAHASALEQARAILARLREKVLA